MNTDVKKVPSALKTGVFAGVQARGAFFYPREGNHKTAISWLNSFLSASPYFPKYTDCQRWEL